MNIAERKQKREAILEKLNKKAYFQGGGGPNDPATLGYPNEIVYPRDLGEDPRMWEQSWFEGAAAETKQVMGPQGSELELKQRMFRAEDKVVALKKLANELDSVIDEMDSKKMYSSAQQTEAVFRDVVNEIHALTEKKATTDVAELVKLAKHLKSLGHTKEAAMLTEVIEELK